MCAPPILRTKTLTHTMSAVVLLGLAWRQAHPVVAGCAADDGLVGTTIALLVAGAFVVRVASANTWTCTCDACLARRSATSQMVCVVVRPHVRTGVIPRETGEVSSSWQPAATLCTSSAAARYHKQHSQVVVQATEQGDGAD